MDPILEFLLNVLKTVVALIALGLGTERGIEVVKEFFRLWAGRWEWLDIRNEKSFLLAAVVAFTLTYVFGIDVTQYLNILAGYDESLVQAVNALLLMLTANAFHNEFFKAST